MRYGLAVTSIVLVAFLLPLGFMARSLTQERALSAGANHGSLYQQ